MDNKVKNILQYIFWTAVAVVLVWFCVKAIDWKEFLAALRMCRWEYVAMSFVVGCVFIVVRGLRWHMLIQPIDPTITKTLVINAYGIGFIANLVLPKLGEAIKIGYIVKDSGKGADGRRHLSVYSAIGTYLAEKALDAIILIICTVIFLAGSWSIMKDNLQLGGGVMTWALIAILVLAIAFILLCRKMHDRGGIWEKAWNFICGIGRGLTTIGKLEKPWLFVLYTVSIWVSFWLTSALIVWALNDIEPFTTLTSADAFGLMVTGSITTIIPVPGGFGAFHGAVATVMQAVYGIPMGSGMIYATLNHETQILAQAVTGFWCYLSQTFFRK
ncbi:MAG: flippase-like domain-containing protein [Bacteroidales bacterium]|nr:flippase-like domain-containing protein [Bacteroidales bacterium]